MIDDFAGYQCSFRVDEICSGKKVINWIDTRPVSGFYISAITKAEIELGIALLPDGNRKKGLEAAAELMFKEFPDRCLSFDTAAASRYAVIDAEHS